jgi:carbamoyl-phosphate synthase small subunit
MLLCTDGTAVDDLKVSLIEVPDMKGLELASKYRSHIFLWR